jgi:antitoxin VapB
MSMNIKNPEAVQLARRVAGITGESLTGAVVESLRERLERLEGDQDAGAERLAERLLALGRDTARRLPAELRTVDHGALLYDDETGLPR